MSRGPVRTMGVGASVWLMAAVLTVAPRLPPTGQTVLRRTAWVQGRIFVQLLADHEGVPGLPGSFQVAAPVVDTTKRRSRRQRLLRTFEMHVLRDQALHFLKLQVRRRVRVLPPAVRSRLRSCAPGVGGVGDRCPRQLMEHVHSPPILQHLYWNGTELVLENETLGSLGLSPDATVYLKLDAADGPTKQSQEQAFIEGAEAVGARQPKTCWSLTARAVGGVGRAASAWTEQSRVARGRPSKAFAVRRDTGRSGGWTGSCG